jgi:hypothetical protein
MAYRWPAETVFKRIDVNVEDRSCPVCKRYMHGFETESAGATPLT